MKRVVGLLLAAVTLLAVTGCIEWDKPPVAAFTRSPASGDAPLAVFFDGTPSSDPDGTVASYEWGFGDGSKAVGVTTTHTYADPGTYSATLTVTDDAGKTAETMRMVDVTAADAQPPTGTELGDRAPEISLLNVETGQTQSLSDFRGNVILLEFWRSTCSSCRSSMPVVAALEGKFARDGLVVVLVSEDATAEEARAYLKDQGYAFVGLYDADGAARNLYSVDLVPHAFIIDRQGIVRDEDHPIRIRDRNITPWL